MSFIRQKAKGLGGEEIDVRYEAPKNEAGQTAKAFLLPSGKTYVHPMYAFAKSVGAPEESIRESHRGVDGQGNEYVSDQRWIYDLAEATALKAEFPNRLIEVEG